MSARGHNARHEGWQGSKWIRRELRLAIYARDGFTCCWCGSGENLSLDHLWPVRPGKRPDNRPRSLVTACLSCNCTRSHRRLRAWLWWLREDGHDLRAIVRELRRRVSAPVDRVEGRRLLTDPALKAARKQTARAFRQGRLFDRSTAAAETPCLF